MSQPVLPLEPSASSSTRSRRKLGNAQETRDRRRRLVTGALVLGSFVLMVNALFGEYGYLAGVRAKQEYLTRSERLRKLQDENQHYVDQIRALKTDPAALEDAARRTFPIVRPGETLVIIRSTPRPATPSSVPQ